MNNIKLTEKVKGDFEEWYEEKYPIIYYSEIWDRLPLAGQKGFYGEYFRERGIEIIINIQVGLDNSKKYYYRVYDLNKGNRIESTELYLDPDTAFTEAVNQASQIAEEK